MMLRLKNCILKKKKEKKSKKKNETPFHGQEEKYVR